MAEKVIQGVTFACEPMLAKEALSRFLRLTKIIGPGLPKLIETMGALGKENSDQLAAQALSEILDHVDPEGLVGMISEMLEKAQIRDGENYRMIIFDQDFTGDLGKAMEVFLFVLQVQYGPFIDGLVGARDRAMKRPSEKAKMN